MSAPEAAAPPVQGSLSHRQILTIFAGLMIGMFLAALDQILGAHGVSTEVLRDLVAEGFLEL